MLARLRKWEKARATGSASSTGICSRTRVSVAKSTSLPPRAFLASARTRSTRSKIAWPSWRRSVSPSNSPSSRTSSRSVFGSSWRHRDGKCTSVHGRQPQSHADTEDARSHLGPACADGVTNSSMASVSPVSSVALWLAQIVNVTRSVIVTAPVRIADLGGWTDTWFAGHGAVCHLAVRAWRHGPPVGPSPAATGRGWSSTSATSASAHVLPDDGAFAAQASAAGRRDRRGARDRRNRAYHLQVTSGVPPGASTGTSAAVVVAVLAAFDAIAGVPRCRASTSRAARTPSKCSRWARSLACRIRSPPRTAA